MNVLIVEPMKAPYMKEIGEGLKALQGVVGGNIEAVYPFEEPIALICNEEGKLEGLPLNRALRDENGEIYDIISGPFFIAGLGEEDFTSLSPELAEKFQKQFAASETFISIGGEIVAIPVDVQPAKPSPDKLHSEAYKPDAYDNGQHEKTESGKSQTALKKKRHESER